MHFYVFRRAASIAFVCQNAVEAIYKVECHDYSANKCAIIFEIKSVWLKKRQLFEMVILQTFLVILLPITLISFTKLRFRRSF